MNRPNRPTHVNVRAFVGVVGACHRPRKVIDEVCGQAAHSISLGSTHVTYVGRDDAPDAVDGSVESLVLRTGRPFHQDRLFEDGALPGPGELDGKFACLVATPDRLELVTDCAGAGSVFYASQDGGLFFSSHLGLLLEALPSVPPLDDVRVAAHLIAQCQIFDETHFAGTFRLPPAGRLVAEIDANGNVDVRMTSGKGVGELLDIDAPSFSIETFRELIEAGIERERYDDDSVIMLSGGRDSYLISLSHAPHPRRAVTYGEPYSIDYMQAKWRSKNLDFEFLPVPYDDWDFETYLDMIVRLHGGYSGLQTAHNIVGFDRASGKAKLASVGFLGDVFRGRYLERMEEDVQERSIPKMFLKLRDDPVLSEVFPREKAIVEDYVMDTFLDLTRAVGAHRAVASLWIRWKQSNWYSQMFDLCDWYLPVSYPFMQRRLFASWLQADLDNPKHRKVFITTLEQELGSRGFATDYHGGSAWWFSVRAQAKLRAFARARHPTEKWDLRGVARRSRTPYGAGTCSNKRLSVATHRSWQRVLSGEDRAIIPFAVHGSAIIETCRRLGDR